MIICQNLIKEFGTADTVFRAVNDVSFRVEKGEFAALIGASGSGKSTLMNMIGLIDMPTKGSILLDGEETGPMSEKQRAALRWGKIGYVFQSFYLEEAYTVSQNIEMALLISGTEAPERKKRIDECLEQVGLLHKKEALASSLSGGEKQRCCIARAIANRPKLLLADEPCGNLDSENTEKIMELLTQLNRQGTTVLLITHDLEDAKRASHIITLKDGSVISDEK